uniref:uncharacterized protein LOC122596775 n=1 Tax=Erigeron canadensis TaxID=72917 RepID=UPI001CB89A59|nr:uncharacterized protein LOC122596775 [Erigeron canadensis]
MMDQTQTKRHREHSGADAGDPQTTKRQKTSYDNEQQETDQDLQDFFISLYYSDPFLEINPQPGSEPNNDPNQNTKQDLKEDNDEKESVIRHLLEASDDELGIPAVDGGGGDGGDGGDINGVNYLLDLCDGLWELEDEAANYHTLLQSELFM